MTKLRFFDPASDDNLSWLGLSSVVGPVAAPTPDVGFVSDQVVANPDHLYMSYGTSMKLTAYNLCQNDVSPTPFLLLNITSVANATKGTASLSDDVITFTSAATGTGKGGFDYTVTDGTQSSTAHVTIDFFRTTAASDTLKINTLVGEFSCIDSGAGDDRLTGGAGDDEFRGGRGADLLNGGSGDDSLFGGLDGDILYGGEGNDWLSGGAGGDSLYGGAGFDYADYSEFTRTVRVDLGAIFEQDTGAGGLDMLRSIEGVFGGKGNDELIGTKGINFLQGGAGNDLIQGLGGNDNLVGDFGNDTIDGGLGNDLISGGRGRDILTGGSGRDIFGFFEAADSVVGSKRDVITDFVRGQDQISLMGLSFEAGQPLTFVGAARFSGKAGEIRYSKIGVSSITVVEGDMDGNGLVDFQIQLTGEHSLTVRDFIL